MWFWLCEQLKVVIAYRVLGLKRREYYLYHRKDILRILHTLCNKYNFLHSMFKLLSLKIMLGFLGIYLLFFVNKSLEQT